MFDVFAPFWNAIFVQPLVNILVLTYALLGHNFVLAILAATIAVQAVTWPLTMKSLQSSKKMQQLQTSEEWKSIQKKYAKDREKLAQETMRMYKEAGINPAAGCVPTVIQMPLLIAFYQSINLLLAVNPESLLDLTSHLYRSIPFIAEIAKQTIPLQSQFLWLNLAHPDPFYIMPILVAASTWVSQKTMSMPSTDPQQSAMANQMQIMMPVMFGFFALNFPSGLATYWIISSLVRMVIQGFTQGWSFVLPSGLNFSLPGRSTTPAKPDKKVQETLPPPSTADKQITPPPSKSGTAISVNGNKNSNKNSSNKKRARRQARRGN